LDEGVTKDIPPQRAETRSTVCRVCHFEYEGDECPWCKAEREHASGVIEERGRRSRRFEEYLEGEDNL